MTEELRQPTKQMSVSEDVMIQMLDVHKWYGEFHVLKNIDLTVNKGERIVVCGPSGSGKSTMIRCINRLEEHDEGVIVVDGIELNEEMDNVLMVRREVGMVWSRYQNDINLVIHFMEHFPEVCVLPGINMIGSHLQWHAV